MKYAILLLTVLVTVSCNTQYDGKKVMDIAGNVYVLEHRIGDLYIVRLEKEDQSGKLYRMREKLQEDGMMCHRGRNNEN